MDGLMELSRSTYRRPVIQVRFRFVQQALTTAEFVLTCLHTTVKNIKIRKRSKQRQIFPREHNPQSHSIFTSISFQNVRDYRHVLEFCTRYNIFEKTVILNHLVDRPER